MRGSPALLGRGGRFRQAVPGLSKTASASLPRPRLRAADPPRPAMLGAARRGERQQRKSNGKKQSCGRRDSLRCARRWGLSMPLSQTLINFGKVSVNRSHSEQQNLIQLSHVAY